MFICLFLSGLRIRVRKNFSHFLLDGSLVFISSSVHLSPVLGGSIELPDASAAAGVRGGRGLGARSGRVGGGRQDKVGVVADVHLRRKRWVQQGTLRVQWVNCARCKKNYMGPRNEHRQRRQFGSRSRRFACPETGSGSDGHDVTGARVA